MRKSTGGMFLADAFLGSLYHKGGKLLPMNQTVVSTIGKR